MPGEFESQICADFTKGYRSDLPGEYLEEGESPNLLNVTFEKRQVRVGHGYAKFGVTVRGYAHLAYQVFYTNGTSDLVLITTETFYKWNNSEWQYVSNGTATTVNGAQGAGTTNLVVASSSGFAATEYVGVTLDNGTQHQTTVKSIPDATHIELDDAIPTGRTAQNGAAVVEAAALSGDLDIPPAARMWIPGDKLIVSNGKDNVKSFDGTELVDLSNLPSSGNCQARVLEVYENYLILMFTIEGGTDYPQRVRWCDTGDITNWSTGNAGYEELRDSEDFIVGCERLGPYPIIYRERSIYRMSYRGTTDTLFEFDGMVLGEGAASLYSIADFGDFHIVFGNSNMYEYNGGFDLKPVGDKIFDKIFAHDGTLNSGYIARVFAIYVEELGKAWFFIPAGSDTVPSLMVEYDPSNRSWSLRETYHKLLGYGFYQRSTDKKWNELIGSWAEQTWRWNARRLLANSPTTLVCGYNPKQVYEVDYTTPQDDGNAISWYIETKDYTGPAGFYRFDLFEFEAAGSSVDVYYSKDNGDSWTLLKSITLSADMIRYTIKKQFVAEQARFKFDGSGGGFILKWYRVAFRLESDW